MTQNAYAYLAKRNNTLLSKIEENKSLAKIFLGLLNRLVIICNNVGCEVKDVRFGSASINGEEISARLSFVKGAGTESAVEAKSDFREYVNRKNMRVAKALESNPHLVRFFTQVVQLMANLCEWRGLKFGDLEVDTAYIDKAYLLVLKLRF